MKSAPRVRTAFFLSTALFLLVTFSRARAQEFGQLPAVSYEGRLVSSVELAGRPDMDLAPLRSLISQAANAPFSQEKVDETAAALKSAGHFESVDLHVTLEAGGLRVMFVLQPALYFGIFQFSSASKVFAYTRLLQIAAYPGQTPYTPRRVAEARSNLLDFLRENGYFLATVEPRIESDEHYGVVNVIFQINLGPRARVGRVILSGVTPEKSALLEKSLRSLGARVRGAYLKTGSTYSLDRLVKSTRFLQGRLASNNYLAAQVKLISSEYHAETNRADIKFNVLQGPQISITVTGARISGRARRREIPIYEEDAVDPDLVQEGAQNLKSFFQNRGFFDAQVQSRMEEQSSGVTVVYEVAKGVRGRVEEVKFQGNRNFSSRELRSRVEVKPRRGTFISRGRFSSRLLARSVVQIESLYHNAGYSAATVTPQVTRDDGDVRVTFRVYEGTRDIVASLVMKGNQSIPEDRLVSEGSNLEPGTPYSQEHLRHDRDQIMATYLKEGFLTASFKSDVQHQADDPHRVHVTYEITEGPRVYASIVRPIGAPQTDPRMIVRSVNIKAGQPLNASGLLLGESQLYGLGIFDWVSVDTRRPAGETTDADVLVKLHEGKRNSISYSFGFQATRRGGAIPGGTVAIPGLPVVDLPAHFVSSEETIWGPTGSVQYTRRNLLGRAQSLTAGAYASRLDLQASAAWNIPSFRGSSWTANLSISAERNSENPLFTDRLATTLAQFHKFLNAGRTRSVSLRYSFSRTNLTDLLIPELVLPSDRNVRLSGFSAAFARDTRDSPIDAHKGNYESVDASIYPSALGSNTNFSRFLGQAAYYRQIFGSSTVWANSLRLGLEFAYSGSQVPLSEKFFSGGGSTLRGFPLDGAGPQRPLAVCSNPAELATCSEITVPVGGPQLIVLNSELRFPLGIVSKLGGVIFYDGGNVYLSVGVHDFFRRFSNTVGGGLRFSTPVGPIRFDFGRNLNPVPGLNPTQFFVTLGQAF